MWRVFIVVGPGDVAWRVFIVVGPATEGITVAVYFLVIADAQHYVIGPSQLKRRPRTVLNQ